MKKSSIPLAVMVLLSVPALAQAPDSDSAVKTTVEAFEEAVNSRDLHQIENLVSSDIVVFENGHRNDGWRDFRDNHLLLEFKEPAPKSTGGIVKIVTSGEMAWAYTESTLEFNDANKTSRAQLWTVYVLQRDREKWKIHLLDWSMRRLAS